MLVNRLRSFEYLCYSILRHSEIPPATYVSFSFSSFVLFDTVHSKRCNISFVFLILVWNKNFSKAYEWPNYIIVASYLLFFAFINNLTSWTPSSIQNQRRIVKKRMVLLFTWSVCIIIIFSFHKKCKTRFMVELV